MNPNYLIQNGIDYEDGLNRCLGKKSLYKEVLEAFVRDDILTKVKKALADKNMEEFKLLIHEVKGSSSNISLNAIFLSAKNLNELLYRDDYTEKELLKLFHEFEDKYTVTLNAIQKSLSE